MLSNRWQKLLLVLVVLSTIALAGCDISSLAPVGRGQAQATVVPIAQITRAAIQPTATPTQPPTAAVPSPTATVTTLPTSTATLSPTLTPAPTLTPTPPPTRTPVPTFTPTPLPTPTPRPPPAPDTGLVIRALEDLVTDLYQRVTPSVVHIRVTVGRGRFAREGSGSGFVFDTAGHIVTNNHVVEGASDITVTFADDTGVPASVVGADPGSDLAVIRVDPPPAELHPVELGDSKKVQPGQLAIAIGNPFGLEGSVPPMPLRAVALAASSARWAGSSSPNLAASASPR